MGGWMGRCATCMWWTQDHVDVEEDSGGTCIQRLNDPAERKWRTTADFGCELYRTGVGHARGAAMAKDPQP